MKLFLLVFILVSTAEAFTLNNNFGASFKGNKVNVSVDEFTTCSTAGVTVNELESMIKPAVDKFWNKVPTSKLELKSGGFKTATTNISTGRLCAPTDDACITAAGGTVIPPVKNIVIACNNSALNFGDPSVLAVTIPNNFDGKKIVGAVILINDSSAVFSGLSRDDQIGVIAHEIGHAIGLGHTDDKAALMYYRTVDQRKSLGEDDMRGVTYLYPMHIDGGGVLGGCGTIQNAGGPPTNPPFWQMGAMLALMVLAIELKKLLNRAKARASA